MPAVAVMEGVQLCLTLGGRRLAFNPQLDPLRLLGQYKQSPRMYSGNSTSV